MKIINVFGRELLDSRGNPTVEAEVVVEGNFLGRAICPSGASTGERESIELRDNDKSRYNGKGVLRAVENINTIISKAIVGKSFLTQKSLDNLLIELDGTENKSILGANAILPVSMAFAKAMASSKNISLYRQLIEKNEYLLPVPCMNVINGGRHADNNIDFQEFMIAPHNAASFKESIRKGIEVFHSLKSVLKNKGYHTGVGDEGGFAPNLKSNEEAIEVILEAISKAGYLPGKDISICLDPATSEMWENGQYKFFKSTQKTISSDELINLWVSWTKQYPIILIEDGMAENDWDGWKLLTDKCKNKIQLVADDIFVTNTEIIKKGIEKGIANSVLIKLNQIGTLTETIEAIEMTKRAGYTAVVSHRSGETEEPAIADLAVAMNTGFIKTGSASRTDRLAKYNQLLRIEEQLGAAAKFNGKKVFYSIGKP